MVKSKEKAHLYPKTCNLIYNLASKRISAKYQEWHEKNPKLNTQINFFPEDEKLIGKVINGRITKNNPYLLTPRIQQVIMEKLSFDDANELYWGDDPSQYFQEFFTTLLLEAQEYKNYSHRWMKIPLSTEKEIADFYTGNRIPIIEIGESNNPDYPSLIDHFIDFTLNKMDYLDFAPDDKSPVYLEQELVYKKDGEETLTFVQLPKKIDTFVEKVFIDFITSICLNHRIDLHINS